MGVRDDPQSRAAGGQVLDLRRRPRRVASSASCCGRGSERTKSLPYAPSAGTWKDNHERITLRRETVAVWNRHVDVCEHQRVVRGGVAIAKRDLVTRSLQASG